MGCSCDNQDVKDPQAKIAEVSSKWAPSDYVGTAMVRLSVMRKDYKVKPGLYRIGEPGQQSDVFVSANYKLSFDILRRNLAGLNAWILVLDTKGINVWCAAGKGSFGTMELIAKIHQTGLGNMVGHRRLIVPQLGAPGIAAHEVRASTGFKVKYGPVRAEDIKAFVTAGYKADETMRTVRFSLLDRLILIPVEVVNSLKYLLIALLLFVIFAVIDIDGNAIHFLPENALLPLAVLMTAYLSGTFLSPLLLPWIPSRYFAAKGLIVGFISYITIYYLLFHSFGIVSLAGWMLLSLAISSFLAMNFTGATTYTSLSGVRKEMKFFVPVQLGLSVLGIVLLITSKMAAL